MKNYWASEVIALNEFDYLSPSAYLDAGKSMINNATNYMDSLYRSGRDAIVGSTAQMGHIDQTGAASKEWTDEVNRRKIGEADEQGNVALRGTGLVGAAQSLGLDQLANFMTQHKDATVGTLAAAGLFGAWYLWKRIKNGFKPDKASVEYAQKLNQVKPEDLSQEEANAPAQQ